MNFKPATQWLQYRRQLLAILIALMATAAALKLGSEFYRLVWESGPAGAVDLKHLHQWVMQWFAGEFLYQKGNAAQYPPATYLMLWPLLGWLSVNAARWFWAFAFVVAAGATIVLAIRISGAETRPEKMLVTLLLLSINGTGVAIGNGQLILFILPALLAVALVLEQESENLCADLAAACMLCWAMMKPSVALPFLWVFLFAWKRWRPALLTLVVYALLTLLAATFQKDDLPGLLKSCAGNASAAVTRFPGTRNLHAVLVAFGLEKWMALSSALAFAALGAWTYLNRYSDRVALIGVAALVARMWTYHRVYDDALILLPELALFRIAKHNFELGQRTIAGGLLILSALAMLCPARLLDPSELAWSAGWNWACTTSHAILWLAILIYLAIVVGRQRAAAFQPPSGRL